MNSASDLSKTFCVHVSPTGQDDNPGTRERPFASLEAARDAVRRARRTENGPMSVLLHAGLYPRAAPFILRKGDSGNPTGPITYAAFGDGPVVLTGGVSLDRRGFVKLSSPELRARILSEAARDQVLQIDLKPYGLGRLGRLRRHGFLLPVPLPPNELFINGKRMQRSRWPKGESLRTGPMLKEWIGRPLESRAFSLAKRGPLENLYGHLRSRNVFLTPGGAFRCDSDRLRHWKEAEELWVDGVFSRDWAWSYNKVAAIDAATGAVALADPEAYPLRNEGGGHFFFDNLLEEIAEPGEYILDNKRGLLYLLPPEDFWAGKPAITISKLAGPLLSLKKVSYVTFEGLVLEGGRDVALACSGGVGNRMVNCEVRNFGRGGLVVEGVAQAVDHCHIHEVGGTAVCLRGGNLATLEAGELRLSDCHIHHWGRWQKVYAPAVELEGVGNVVTNCHLHHGPHMAVTISGNDHVIEHNEIHRVVLEFRDMGAIYINQGREPLRRGTIIRGNFIHHLGHRLGLIFGIYPDRGTMGLLIEKNVFYAIGSLASPTAKAIGGNGFAHVIVRGNLFLDCTTPYELAFYLADWGWRDLAPLKRAWRRRLGRRPIEGTTHGKRYPELKTFFEEDRIMPDTNVFEGNLIYNRRIPKLNKGVLRTVYGPSDLVQERENWIATKEGSAAIVETGQRRLKLDPIVFESIPGFAEIDLEKIGPRGPPGPVEEKAPLTKS